MAKRTPEAPATRLVVEYVGTSDSRSISTQDWADNGIRQADTVWDASNGKQIEVSDLDDAAVDFLVADELDFKLLDAPVPPALVVPPYVDPDTISFNFNPGDDNQEFVPQPYVEPEAAPVVEEDQLPGGQENSETDEAQTETEGTPESDVQA